MLPLLSQIIAENHPVFAFRTFQITISILSTQVGTRFVDVRGFAARFSESYPLPIAKICLPAHFYDEFWQKIPAENYLFLTIFAYFSAKPTHVWGKYAEKWLLFREFWAKNPLICAALTRTPNMLCIPPRDCPWIWRK